MAEESVVRVYRTARMGIVGRAQGATTKAVPVRTVEEEQRSDRPQDPRALRVAAARGHLARPSLQPQATYAGPGRRCRASTMHKTSPAARRLASGPAALATRLLYTLTTG